MFLRLLYYGFRLYCFFVRPVRTGVRVMMIQKNKITLVKQTYMDGWFMPGGGLKRGETLEGAARREAREETGAELGELKLLGIYTSFKDWKTDHNVVFIFEDFRIICEPDKEIKQLKTFGLDELPDDLWPGHLRRLEEYKAGHAQPQFGEW
jgi:8-oxo-dGTP pyrophosphatase MutT (NUDIX family)